MRINWIVVVGVVASLVAMAMTQIETGADAVTVVWAVVTAAAAAFARDTDGDGRPDVVDSTPRGGE